MSLVGSLSKQSLKINFHYLPLHFYFYSARAEKLKKFICDPFVTNAFYGMYEVHKYFNILSKLPQSTPICGNENVPPVAKDRSILALD